MILFFVFKIVRKNTPAGCKGRNAAGNFFFFFRFFSLAKKKRKTKKSCRRCEAPGSVFFYLMFSVIR